MQKQKYDVTGMTCAACQAHVEKAVGKLDGVKSVNVNLLSNNMQVEYDENKLNEKRIIEAVLSAGYGASLARSKKGQNAKANVQDAEILNMKKRLIISILFLLPLMYVSMHHMLTHYLNIPTPMWVQNTFDGTQNALKFAITQLVLLIPILIVNRKFFTVGFKKLAKLNPNMDSLIAIGSSASTLYGLFAIFKICQGFQSGDLTQVDRYRMDVYFESAGMILTLVTLGKFLEAKSKGKTHDAISKLMNLAPQTAIVFKDKQEKEVRIEEIQKEDIIIIKPGFRIPVDGVVVEGSSWLDQSAITGESIPVLKQKEDAVISGTVNQNGSFKMRATKVGEDTTLAKIIQIVEEAGSSKAPMAKLADKVAGVFVPVVILIAVLTFIIWLLVGQSLEFALSMGISVLVISCPCALGLATPVAVMVGTGKASENGILIKSAESLEALCQMDTVVLDKTGTITIGKPKVTKILSNIEEEKLLKIAGGLEQNSEHPLAKAIIEEVKERNIELAKASDFEAFTGKGVKAKIENEVCFGGNEAFLKEQKIDVSSLKKQGEALLEEGKTLLYFASSKELLGIIAVSDTIKETSKSAIQALQEKNIDVMMITGDNEKVANAIAKEVGITKVIAEVLPQNKEEEVRNLKEQGKKVLFVGDGINDSPALMRADVGMAIGDGTDIAIESADVVLMNQNLLSIPTAIELSQKVVNNIKLNLFWAFFYNVVGIPIAAGVFYKAFGLKLNPMIGAAAMSLSSVCVVTNALRLRKFQSHLTNASSKNCSSTQCSLMNIEESDAIATSNQNQDKEESQMNEFVKTIGVEGMMCEHCKKHVTEALSKIEGVTNVEVSLEEKNAKIVSNKEIEDSIIQSAIQEAGYQVIE